MINVTWMRDELKDTRKDVCLMKKDGNYRGIKQSYNKSRFISYDFCPTEEHDVAIIKSRSKLPLIEKEETEALRLNLSGINNNFFILLKQKPETTRLNTWTLTLKDIDPSNIATLNDEILEKNKDYDIRLEDVIRIKCNDEIYVRLHILDSQYAISVYRDEDYDPNNDGFCSGRLFSTKL